MTSESLTSSTITDEFAEKETPVDHRSISDRNSAKGKVLLVVCLFEDNFGDKLIYNTIDKKLRQAGFETEAVEVSQSLAESRLIEKANNSDFLYFVGGGIIERYAPEIIRSFDSLRHSLKTPHGVVGLSAGEFDYSDFHESLRLFCDTASFFFARDEETVEVFKKAGASRLPTAGVDVVLANDTISKLRRTGHGITASFRNVPYIDVTGDLDWGRWPEALKKAGVESLIPDCSASQSRLDIPICDAPILRQIADAGIVIAMRYHVVLAAAMMGALPIPIAYCPKVARLAEQLGIGEFCLGIHDHNRLEEVLGRLRAEEDAIRRRVAGRVVNLERNARAIINQSINTMERVINAR
ncbi:MAG: polysaccharide pyruvyl transferase family protein [Armatimonadota bacterium]|nr:polysaccharide pyruvyl transferase family protein [Armatimonadota bacterium]